MFTFIFLSLFTGAWALCGASAWLAASVATRGEAGLGMLPLAMGAGIIAGLAVPVLVRDDGLGLFLSLAAALALPAVFIASRLYARAGMRAQTLVKEPGNGGDR